MREKVILCWINEQFVCLLRLDRIDCPISPLFRCLGIFSDSQYHHTRHPQRLYQDAILSLYKNVNCPANCPGHSQHPMAISARAGSCRGSELNSTRETLHSPAVGFVAHTCTHYKLLAYVKANLPLSISILFRFRFQSDGTKTLTFCVI